MTPNKVLCARSIQGPVFTESHRATCYCCDEELTFVRGHVRRLSDSKQINVSSHFRHLNGINCNPETILHKAAKHAVSSNDLEFFLSCDCCNHPTQINLPRDCEKREELRWENYILDVGFIRQGLVLGAVEVYVTHRVPSHKSNDMSGYLTWCEVEAKSILDALIENKTRVEAMGPYICRFCELGKNQDDSRNDIIFDEAKVFSSLILRHRVFSRFIVDNKCRREIVELDEMRDRVKKENIFVNICEEIRILMNRERPRKITFNEFNEMSNLSKNETVDRISIVNQWFKTRPKIKMISKKERIIVTITKPLEMT